MDAIEIIPITANLGSITEPIIFTTTLHLLSYFVALIRRIDVDNPRNLQNQLRSSSFESSCLEG